MGELRKQPDDDSVFLNVDDSHFLDEDPDDLSAPLPGLGNPNRPGAQNTGRADPVSPRSKHGSSATRRSQARRRRDYSSGERKIHLDRAGRVTLPEQRQQPSRQQRGNDRSPERSATTPAATHQKSDYGGLSWSVWLLGLIFVLALAGGLTWMLSR